MGHFLESFNGLTLELIDRAPVKYRNTIGPEFYLTFWEVESKREKFDRFPKTLLFYFPDTIASFYLEFGTDSALFHWVINLPQEGYTRRRFEGHPSGPLRQYVYGWSQGAGREVLLCILLKQGYTEDELQKATRITDAAKQLL